MNRSPAAGLERVDPFDLPEWLGLVAVQWSAEGSPWGGCLVRGTLSDPGGDRPVLPCDLFAVDEAYPEPVSEEAVRRAAHQAWQHGQVLLGSVEGRLRLMTPGHCFEPETLLETVGRLAKAVGAVPASYSVVLCAR